MVRDAMIPFMVVGTWYTGTIAKAMNGTDLSFLVGLVVSTAVYMVLARSLDLEPERQIERDEGGMTLAELAEGLPPEQVEPPR